MTKVKKLRILYVFAVLIMLILGIVVVDAIICGVNENRRLLLIISNWYFVYNTETETPKGYISR